MFTGVRTGCAANKLRGNVMMDMNAWRGVSAHNDFMEYRHVGGEISRTMVMARIAQDTGEADRRRATRRPVELDARLRELGTTGTEARILNISETGFMAETNDEFEVGARVWLMLPGRERANAVVKWVAGDKIGAEFSEPVSVNALTA